MQNRPAQPAKPEAMYAFQHSCRYHEGIGKSISKKDNQTAQ